MKAEAKRLRELLGISRAIAGSADYDAILELVVEKACVLTDADVSLLLLAEPGAEGTIVASSGLPRDETQRFAAALDERITSRLRERFELAGAIIAVPMILRGDVRGILALGRRYAGPLAEATEELLSALADQAAIALGNATHLRELERALADADRERRAREQLLESLTRERTWLRAVISHSPIPIILIEGPRGECVRANSAAEELFGRPIEPSAGLAQYAAQILSPDGSPLSFDEIPCVTALRGGVVGRELAIRRPDGTTVPVLASAAAIGSGNDCLGAVALYKDISTLKDLERMRTEWTAIVAHDLRQPINSIALGAELLVKKERTAEDIQSFARQIQTSAKRLERMIHDLLDVSLIEAKHLPLKRCPHDVRALLVGLLDSCRWLTRGRTIELTVEPGVPSIEVDADRMLQVITNFLSNAVKYGDAEAPIEVRAGRTGEAVQITVRNRGPGIPETAMATLFQRFKPGQRRAAQGQSLGLGLYITKGIVEAHGGRVWAESEPGDATALHVLLPAENRCVGGAVEPLP